MSTLSRYISDRYIHKKHITKCIQYISGPDLHNVKVKSGLVAEVTSGSKFLYCLEGLRVGGIINQQSRYLVLDTWISCSFNFVIGYILIQGG